MMSPRIELLGAVAADELAGEDVKFADIRQDLARIGDVVLDLPALHCSVSRERNGCDRLGPGLQLRGLAGRAVEGTPGTAPACLQSAVSGLALAFAASPHARSTANTIAQIAATATMRVSLHRLAL